MSEPTNSRSLAERVGQAFFKVALTLFLLWVLFFFLMVGLGSGTMETLIALFFGWVGFINRTASRISWNWDLVCMGFFCSLLVIGLAQTSLSWITRSISTARGKEWRWPWRWTICGLVSIILFFLVGMSVGGAVHQIGWISASEEPWYERKPRHIDDIINLNQLDLDLRTVLLDTNSVAEVRRGIWDEVGSEKRRARGLQSFHILLVVGSQQMAEGAIIFPRDPEAQRRLGAHFITSDDSKRIPANELPELLKAHGTNLLTF